MSMMNPFQLLDMEIEKRSKKAKAKAYHMKWRQTEKGKASLAKAQAKYQGRLHEELLLLKQFRQDREDT